jgi:hypothetical protein
LGLEITLSIKQQLKINIEGQSSMEFINLIADTDAFDLAKA